MPPAKIKRTERDKTVSTIIVIFPVSPAHHRAGRRSCFDNIAVLGKKDDII
jgi:hypothetical protein